MKATMSDYDVAIVGGGHNSLVCSWYLARAGLKVVIFEARGIIGGAAVTEEFHPGFRNSTASYTVSLLNPKIIADMDLPGYGLEILERSMSNFFPLDDTRYLKLPVDVSERKVEFSRFSEEDAANLERYENDLEIVADLLREQLLQTPPNSGGNIKDLLKAAILGFRAIRQPIETQRLLLDMASMSCLDFLSRYFKSDVIRAAYAFDGIVGAFASPSMPGTAYVLLHHCFGEVNGKQGIWGHAKGGMGAITQAMAKAAAGVGVEIRTNVPVEAVLTENNKAIGVLLENGEAVTACKVAAGVAPKRLFGKLVEKSSVPKDFRERILNMKSGSGTFRMNVALNELPQFSCLPVDGKAGQVGIHHTAGIIINPSVDYMEKAYRDASIKGWSAQPIIELLIPSVVDDSLAPKGQHVASLFCQHVMPHLPNGQSWGECREEVADVIIDTVTEYAPNFKESIVARQIHSPLDLEKKFGLIDGDIFHGQLCLNQLFSARPVLGHADYRMPLQGLYLCGSGAHPGGGVTGVPGHNAAQIILADS